MKKRIVCMLLALLLLVGMLPVGVFAEGKTEYEKNETGTAVFNSVLSGQIAYVSDDPTLGWNSSTDYTITVDKALLSQTFTISDSYVDGSGYWYKLAPIGEEAMPAKLSAKPWVYQNDIPTGGNVDALIITPPANTCRCCESCTGDENCECGCGECDYCEPVTTDPTTPTDPSQPECGCCDACTDAESCTCGCEACKFCEKEETCGCCDACADAEGCTCGCETCKFCEKEETCGCCENCANAEGCTCGCEACKFCEPEVPEDPEIPTVTDETTGAKVYVETLPEGVKLAVDTDVDGSALLSDFRLSDAQLVFAWDISLRNADNTEYQPGSGAMVKIPVNAAAGTKIGLLHKHSGGTSFMGVTEVLADGTIEFYTDSFSEFAGFTVDFHYNGVDCSIPGLSEIRLSELFEIMEIEENAFAATSVVFSDNSLIGVQQQADGDWLLTSLEAFQTEETLIITFTGGRSIVIDVTDAVGKHSIWDGWGEIDLGWITISNKGDYYLYTLSEPKNGATGHNGLSSTKHTNSYMNRSSGSAVLGIVEEYKGNYWFYGSGSNCDVWVDDDQESDFYVFKVKATEKNTGKVYIDRIDRTVLTKPDVIKVYQRRYSATSADKRTTILTINGVEDTGSRSYVYFASRGDSRANNQIEVSLSDTENYYYPGSYSYSAGVYTVPIYTRYNVVFHANGGGGNMNNQGFIWGVEQRLNPNKFTAPTYTVTYVSNGGSEYFPASVNTKFGGWKYGEKVYGDNANIPANGALSAEPGGLVDLYAKWDPVSSVTLPNPTKDGYTFGGWYTDESFTEATKVTETTYTPTSDVTLYAKWEPNIYKVTLNNMGATTAGTANYWYKYNTVKDNVYYYTDANCTTALTNSYITLPTKDGNIFGGYYSSTDFANATQYVNADGLCVNNLYKSKIGDTTLYAKWTEISYTITFDEKGATSGDIADKTLAWDEEYALPTPEKKYTVTYDHNYAVSGMQVKTSATAQATFNGWKNGNSVYTGGTVVSKLTDADDATVSFVADWSDVPSVTLPTPTRTGYTFGGWYTDAACSATKKVTGTTYTPTSDVTLYAKWTPDTREVTYKYEGTAPSGAPAVPAKANVMPGTSTKVAEVPSLAGYTFSGWNTSDATVSKGSFTMPDKAVTFTGDWSENTYNISYDLDEGELDENDENPATYQADSANFTLHNPKKDGYEFTGWTESISTTNWTNGFINLDTGACETYNAGYPNSVYSEKIFLEAGVTYKLEGTNLNGIRWRYFDTNGNFLGNKSLDDTFTPDVDGYVQILLYEGCTEANRNAAKITSSQGTTVLVKTGSTGDRAYTANWSVNTYTITYNHNDVTSGDPTITTDTYTIEEALTLAEAPTREGYKFTGWELEKAVTEPDGNWDADTYSAAQTFEKGKYGDITLVAQWEEQYRYVLNFDANGGSGAPDSITKEWCDDKEHTFTWTEVPTRTGYTFMGWAEEATSEENVAGADKNSIKLDGKAAETVSKTIFAIWKRDTGTIQFNYSGGVPVVVTVTCTDAVNDSEKITINTVITGITTIKDLPTGTYEVTAESGNANYTASVNPGSTQLKSGETANFDLSVSDRGFNWMTGFAHVINKRGG